MSTSHPTAKSEDLLHILQEQTVRIAQLEQENQLLRTQISDKLGIGALSDKSTAPHQNSQDHKGLSYHDLRIAYADLQTQHEQRSRQVARLQDKYERAKEVTKKWSAYVDNLVDQSRARRLRGIQQPLPLSSSTESKAGEKLTSPGPTSSQTTILEDDHDLSKELQEQDVVADEPVVVSERRLKKRRIGQESHPIKQESQSGPQPISISSDDQQSNGPLLSQVSDLNESPRVQRRHLETQSEGSTSNAPFEKSKQVIQQHAASQGRKRRLPEVGGEKRGVLTSLDTNAVINRPSPSKLTKRLRSRPVTDLKLDDFRLNPSYRGPVLSFGQSLRPDTGRTCLPSCTRQACCGHKFRRMIEIGGKEVTGKTDREALEAQYGPEYRDVMAAYGPDKRKELVLQAHAMCLAEQSSASTKKNNRPSTPPGFWRMDMASTQELQAQNEEAERLERSRIEERRYEALRPNGMWLFKDEL